MECAFKGKILLNTEMCSSVKDICIKDINAPTDATNI